MQTTGVGVLGQQGAQNPTGHDAFQEVNLDDFLKLLLTELQNQDPLDPMDNSQILEQMSQIREIESNTRLTDTLEAVLLGQALSTASSLIGRYVEALTNDGERIAGRVERVAIVDGKPAVRIDGHDVQLENISEILAEEPENSEEGT
jgi:flagellar basal-body rod modification protein FlgD